MGEPSPLRKGRLHKGTVTAPTKAAPGLKTPHSIPAKFETVLFSGPREKKGFSSEAKRFNDHEHDLPGPGAYTPSKDVQAQDSMSRKGYGAIISRSKRFQTKVCYTGPGPSDYRRADAALEDRSFSRAVVSAPFQGRTTLPRKTVVHDAAPGPGAYEPAAVTRTGARMDYLSRPGATSAFKAGAHKLILSGNLEAPPPASYHLGDPWDRSKVGSRSPSRGGTSSFGGGGRGGQSIGSMVTNLDTLLFGPSAAAPPDSVPGPGQYELTQYGSISHSVAKQMQRPSPAFQQPMVEPRAIRSANGRIEDASTSSPPAGPADAPPARTAFRPFQPLRSPGPGVAAPFKSTAPGHVEAVEQASFRASSNAPGPAYYQPNVTVRKSFHSNMKKHYVTVAS